MVTNSPSMESLSRHVLIVDDYSDALEVWTLLLQANGYGVAAAADGMIALDLARARRPDVVVLDLQLPTVSGIEVARRLRDEAQTARVPLIALTGRTRPRDLDEARAAGFDIVLTKPCDPSDLLDAIEQSLRNASPAAAPQG